VRVERGLRSAAEVRALVPRGESFASAVAEILSAVRDGGDAALRELTMRYDTGGADPGPLRVPTEDLEGALAELDGPDRGAATSGGDGAEEPGREAGASDRAPGVRAALELAIENVRAVAEAGVDGDREVSLSHGQRVTLRDVPVARAAIYVPSGRAPYPSTVVMGVVTAQAARVQEVVVCSPPGLDGKVLPLVRAACALTGVDEVYAIGGAQAIGALAYGTETIRPVDVIVGPGNLWVQEAKRQVAGAGLVGIDGFAGPSDLLVVLSEGADVQLAALDLRAQAEHGGDSLVAAVSPDAPTLDALAEILADAPEQGACALIHTEDLEQALVFANDFAPEHMELIGPAAEALAPRITRAGCLFVGAGSATAFGDYVAGSNHVLPTDGAARFASGLSARTFRRRMAEVRIPPSAAAKLAPAGAALAQAEGFTTHAESMQARIRENGER
jgi:histidinol dehydrogenase